MVSFLRSSGSLYHDLADRATMVFGDGSPAGLVRIPRAVLNKICEQAAAKARTAASGDTEVGGVLIGPASQTNDLFLEDAIPFGIEYQFGRDVEKLLDSIRQALPPGQRDGTTPILGFYRILRKSYRKLTEGELETLTAIRETYPSFSSLRCCFLVAPVVTSQILLHVLMCNGPNWEEIQQVVYHLEPSPVSTLPDVPTPSTQPAPDLPKTNFDAFVPVRPRSRQASAPTAKGLETAGRRARRRKVVAFAASILLFLAVLGGTADWIIEKRGLINRDAGPRVSSRAAVRTGFSASPDGSAWKLTWDSAAVVALKPTNVIISINDGAGQQDVALTTADLSSGTIYYNPKGGDFAFRFRVVKDGVTLAEERLRVIARFPSASRSSDEFQSSKVQVPRPESRGGVPGSTLVPAGSVTVSPAPQEYTTVTGTIARRGKIRNFRIFQPPIVATGTSTQSSSISTAGAPITTGAVPPPPTPALAFTFAAPPVPPSTVP